MGSNPIPGTSNSPMRATSLWPSWPRRKSLQSNLKKFDIADRLSKETYLDGQADAGRQEIAPWLRRAQINGFESDWSSLGAAGIVRPHPNPKEKSQRELSSFHRGLVSGKGKGNCSSGSCGFGGASFSIPAWRSSRANSVTICSRDLPAVEMTTSFFTGLWPRDADIRDSQDRGWRDRLRRLRCEQFLDHRLRQAESHDRDGSNFGNSGLISQRRSYLASNSGVAPLPLYIRASDVCRDCWKDVCRMMLKLPEKERCYNWPASTVAACHSRLPDLLRILKLFSLTNCCED